MWNRRVERGNTYAAIATSKNVEIPHKNTFKPRQNYYKPEVLVNPCRKLTSRLIRVALSVEETSTYSLTSLLRHWLTNHHDMRRILRLSSKFKSQSSDCICLFQMASIRRHRYGIMTYLTLTMKCNHFWECYVARHCKLVGHRYCKRRSWEWWRRDRMNCIN